ncbi:hypothetical protein BT96DRAFT_987968 [Gymnopus androsaceus JB14]|uniref:non-specific serine/threonine protein kinase n=1 Tax=Gymnopus androsaceus JB14 TaxID=1447944 RepID=A0A6A4I608_9AGAR|nr:hypothetical protein BT96DRAFT_987968 [Gymnopus androsaceus JB14]
MSELSSLSESDLHWPGIPDATEELERYTLVGFHPVHLGDVFSSESAVYRVLQKLGWGSFATVWLAMTLQGEAENPQHPSRYVALKICVANADSDHELNGSHTVLVYTVLARVMSLKLWTNVVGYAIDWYKALHSCIGMVSFTEIYMLEYRSFSTDAGRALRTRPPRRLSA